MHQKMSKYVPPSMRAKMAATGGGAGPAPSSPAPAASPAKEPASSKAPPARDDDDNDDSSSKPEPAAAKPTTSTDSKFVPPSMRRAPQTTGLSLLPFCGSLHCFALVCQIGQPAIKAARSGLLHTFGTSVMRNVPSLRFSRV